jgi:hypothetical protein
MGGSLVFEAFSAKTDWEDDGGVLNNLRKWSVRPRPYDNGTSPSRIYMAHLKFIDGAGKDLFPYDNESDQAIPIVITATLEKDNDPFGECKLTTAGDHFELELPSDKRLRRKFADSPANSRRQRVRYMHRFGFEPDECDWLGLKIVKGNQVLFNEPNLRRLPGYDETMRLMIWWENR